jgi:hypothetical protein
MLIFSLLAIVVVLNYEYAQKRVPERLSRKPIGLMTVPLKAGTGPQDKRPSTGRDRADESRREAFAARMASLILAMLIMFILVSCIHVLTHWL